MALRHGHSHTSLREQPCSTFTNTLRAGQGTARTPELNDIATVAIGRIKSQDQHCIGYRDLYRATTRTRDTQARSHSRILPRPWRIPHAYRANDPIAPPVLSKQQPDRCNQPETAAAEWPAFTHHRIPRAPAPGGFYRRALRPETCAKRPLDPNRAA